MSSTLPGSVGPQQPVVQAIPAAATAAAAAAAATQPPSGKLSLTDITKYFHIPIADAAQILGVCTSVLKRICRENGIIRWPYRKFLAGKTVDDIKKEATREKIKESTALSNTAKQNLDAPKMMPPTSVGLSTFGNQVQNRALGQQGVSVPGNTSQPQGNRNFHHGWASTVQNQTRHVPTFFDDFKYGFPANGLSSVSVKWWGSNSVESGEELDSAKSTPNEEGKQDSCKLTDASSGCKMIDEQIGSEKKDNTIIMEPSSSLVSLRKRAVECGREPLQAGISNCEPYKLSKRKRLLLLQIFRSSSPDQWKGPYS